MQELLAAVHAEGPSAAPTARPSFDEFTSLVGLPEIDALARRFASPPEA